MGKLPKFYDENLLVGIETSDDAAIYKITDDIALIQTVDFFTPIVDDPYTFGQIAAANSLSDVYAMGGEPKIALNIVGFPNCLPPEVLGDILAGGADKVKEAGAVLVGGHTVQDDEPKYGLCVSGFVHPQRIFKNYGCKVGDVLVLTKQVGSGIINTAIKAEMAEEEVIGEAVLVMKTLNKKAKEVAEKFNINACTDVTGFGLLGHGVEMASASKVSFELFPEEISYLKESIAYARMGLVPAGSYNNRTYFGGSVDTGEVEEYYIDLLFDPQTSGGLLLSLPEREVQEILKAFEEAKMETKVSVIGRVVEEKDKSIYLRRREENE